MRILENFSIENLKKEVEKVEDADLLNLNFSKIEKTLDKFRTGYKHTFRNVKQKELPKLYKEWMTNIESNILDLVKLKLKLDTLTDSELLKHFKAINYDTIQLDSIPFPIKFKETGEELSLTDIQKIISLKFYPQELERLIEKKDLEKLSAFLLEKAQNKKYDWYDSWLLQPTAFWSDPDLMEVMKKIIIKEKNKTTRYFSEEFLKSISKKGNRSAIRTLYWFQKNHKGCRVRKETAAALLDAKYYFFIKNFKEYNFLETEELLDKVLIEFDKEYNLTELKKEKELFKFYKYQLERIEDLLASKRLYSYKNWFNIFNENNLMKDIASKLLWGTYKDGILDKTFMFKDGQLLDINGDTLSLNNESITLVHPTELSEDTLKSWNSIFKKNKIKQPFPQLARDTYFIKDTLLPFKELTSGSFASKKLGNKLLQQGWFSYHDFFGFFKGYYKEFDSYPLGIKFGYEEGKFDDDSKVAGIVEEHFYHKNKYSDIYKLMFPSKTYAESYADVVKEAEFIKESEKIDIRLFSEIYREIKLLTKAASH